MVQIKRRFAAVRVRSSSVALRTGTDDGWQLLDVRQVTRARRPWVVRVELADGSATYLRPFLPGEAGLPDCGARVGGVGDSETLGNDPVSAVIALIAIPFYVLASPFFVAANWRRTRVATRLRQELTGS
jgi:hypothetical protein